MIEILRDHGLLFLVGAYPNGPLGGLCATFMLAACGLALSMPLALALGVARVSPWAWLRLPATAWVYAIRGLPLLMIIFWAYFCVPLLVGHEVSGFTTVVAAIVAYEGAFLAEVVRAGLQALPKGQTEAARALGLGYVGTLRHVLLPQALTNMLPSIVNQFVAVIKATSLAYVVGVQELTLAAYQVNSMTLTRPLAVFAVLAGLYFILCFSLSRGADWLERRLARRHAGVVAAMEAAC
jgi:polar amino acid transport system permease protein